MPAIWMTFADTIGWHDLAQLERRLGWRKGDRFHPENSSSVPETAYVAPDGTRIAIYLSFAFANRRPACLAVYGDAPAATADAIAGAISIRDRRDAEPAFRRLRPENTAVAAADDGVWWLRSAEHAIAFAPRADHDDDADVSPAATFSIASPFAIAAGTRAVYATSCNDPRASELVRIDRETHAVTHVCTLDRPTQLAVIGDIAYVVVADPDAGSDHDIHARTAAALVAVDRTGAIERVPIADLPPPRLLAASPSTGALCWIDATHKHVVAYRAAGGRVIGAGDHLVALDADDDRVYALDYGRRALVLDPHAPTRTIDLTGSDATAGILRLGPLLVTLYGYEESWRSRTCMGWANVGVPRLADAPAALIAAARAHAEEREVLADWLGERGVAVTPELLARTLSADPPALTGADHPGVVAELPGDLAVPLASHDRMTGYFARDGSVERFTAIGLF